MQLFLPPDSPGHACRVFLQLPPRFPRMEFPTKPDRFNRHPLNILVCPETRLQVASRSKRAHARDASRVLQCHKCSRAWTKISLNDLWLLGARAGRSSCEPLPPHCDKGRCSGDCSPPTVGRPSKSAHLACFSPTLAFHSFREPTRLLPKAVRHIGFAGQKPPDLR